VRGRAHAVKQAKKLMRQYSASHKDAADSGNVTDVHEIARHLGIEVVPHLFSYNISGVFFRKDDRLYLGVNSQHHEHRKRFTIAHEIGHYVLHSDEVLHYDSKDVEVFFRSDSISDLNEIEANHFAAELLMPEERVKHLIEENVQSIQELASRFNVSEDAMRYRLINLGYL
jgi:Zn-dependent peptidase ImmA (M78 family)